MVRYDDGRVRFDQEAVTLRRYYFPLATAKRIPYGRIRRYWAQPMGLLTGGGRIWGTGSLRYWLPLDVGRLGRDTLVVLDLGGHVRPAFSPDDPQRVIALRAELTQATSGADR
jgi:hypothetical protein